MESIQYMNFVKRNVILCNLFSVMPWATSLGNTKKISSSMRAASEVRNVSTECTKPVGHGVWQAF